MAAVKHATDARERDQRRAGRQALDAALPADLILLLLRERVASQGLDEGLRALSALV